MGEVVPLHEDLEDALNDRSVELGDQPGATTGLYRRTLKGSCVKGVLDFCNSGTDVRTRSVALDRSRECMTDALDFELVSVGNERVPERRRHFRLAKSHRQNLHAALLDYLPPRQRKLCSTPVRPP